MGSGSRAASCLCCPFKCLACGLFSCLCSILVSLLVTAGVLALILYFVFRPQMIAATVDSASLAQFALGTPASPALLQYNLTLAMTVRNPNKRVGLYYDGVEALALFDGQRFGFAPLDPFAARPFLSLQYREADREASRGERWPSPILAASVGVAGWRWRRRGARDPPVHIRGRLVVAFVVFGLVLLWRYAVGEEASGARERRPVAEAVVCCRASMVEAWRRWRICCTPF